MLLERWDVHEVTDLHFDHAILKLQPRRPLQDDHPLVLRLVVPEICGGSVAVRNDPFDPHVSGLNERLDDFLGQVLGEVIEDVLNALSDVPAARPQRL